MFHFTYPFTSYMKSNTYYIIINFLHTHCDTVNTHAPLIINSNYRVRMQRKKKSSGSWITKCTLLSFKRESTESITHACQHIYYRISLLYVLDCRCFLKGWFICAIAILHCTLFSRLICGDLLFNISISYTMCSEYAVFTLCIHPLTAAVVTVQI